MAKVTPAQWLEKWQRRLNAAGPDITNGVKRVKTAPGEAAAAAAELMLQRLTESVQNGIWAKNVSAVSLSDWQDAMINKGLPRLQQGTAQAVKTKQANIAALLDAVDASAAVARALPKGGLEQSIARATAYMREMSARAPKRQK